MRKILLGVILVSVLVLLGCDSSIEPLRPMPKGEDQVRKQLGEYGVSSTRETSRDKDFSDAPTGTWIFPGKVEISNMFPGARAEEVISVHNGGRSEAEFLIYHENVPGEVAPEGLGDWLFVSDPAPTIGPDEVRDILVALELPEDAVVEDEAWSFLVVVNEASQEGNVRVRNASKWLVTMR